MVYYNEIDKRKCEWLRQLMALGAIKEGTIDERSISDVAEGPPPMFARQHFFAGIGGWELAFELAGVSKFESIWSGSCPCQPFSIAGKRDGFSDERDLWPAFFRLIRISKPAIVVGEQSETAIKHGWLDRLCADLESEGYSCCASVLGAHSASAPHQRNRLYWAGVRLSDSKIGRINRRQAQVWKGQFANGSKIGGAWSGSNIVKCKDGLRVAPAGIEPVVRRVQTKHGFRSMADGISGGLGLRGNFNHAEIEKAIGQNAAISMRQHGYGNAIVPEVAAMFLISLMDSIEKMQVANDLRRGFGSRIDL